MPRPTPKQVKRSPKPTSPPEVVHPIWLVKAVALTILAALICGYLTLCLLFYQGQWQLVLHPTRTAGKPQPLGEVIHFAPDESATPQLTGRWIPAAPGDRYAQNTILFVPSGDGNLADSTPLLNTLHNLGINVFAFDYRGYGQSADTHPNQQKMLQDVESAWQYLTISRAIPAQQIIPYGTGVGASLATNVAVTHPAIRALILDSPSTDLELLDTVLEDRRTRLLPTRLLFNERFPIAKPLAALKTPKLFLLLDESSKIAKDEPVDPHSDAIEDLVDGAAPPKIISNLHSTDFASPIYGEQIRRFLDQYLPTASIPQLVPSPAPSSTIPH